MSCRTLLWCKQCADLFQGCRDKQCCTAATTFQKASGASDLAMYICLQHQLMMYATHAISSGATSRPSSGPDMLFCCGPDGVPRVFLLAALSNVPPDGFQTAAQPPDLLELLCYWRHLLAKVPPASSSGGEGHAIAPSRGLAVA
jgi:hypothetical protein